MRRWISNGVSDEVPPWKHTHAGRYVWFSQTKEEGLRPTQIVHLLTYFPLFFSPRPVCRMKARAFSWHYSIGRTRGSLRPVIKSDIYLILQLFFLIFCRDQQFYFSELLLYISLHLYLYYKISFELSTIYIS